MDNMYILSYKRKIKASQEMNVEEGLGKSCVH